MKSYLFIASVCLVSFSTQAQFDQVWANTAGASTNDIAFSVSTDPIGDIVVTGFFNGTVDFDPGPAIFNLIGQGSNDLFLAKYSSSGTFLWAFALGSADSEFGNAVKTDAAGNIYLSISFSDVLDIDPGPGVANFTSTGFTANSILAKYDVNGNYLWGVQLASTTASSINGITFDNSNNILITGTFYGTVDFDPSGSVLNLIAAGSSDIFFAKYNIAGELIFAKNIGGVDLDAGSQITTDNLGNILVTGGFRTSADFDPGPGNSTLNTAGINSLTDIFFAKYDANGNYLWAKSLGGNNNDMPGGLAIDNSNNIFLCGTIRDLIDFDPGTNTILLGPTPVGGEDFFLAGYNPNGDYLWAQVSGGSSFDFGTHITINNENEIYLSGRFAGTVDFDPGPGVYTLTSLSGQHGFLARYTTNGQFLNAASMGGSASTVAEEIAVINDDTVIVVGQFSGTTDFNTGAGTDNRTAVGGSDLFIGKYAVSQSALPITLRDFRFVCKPAGVLLTWISENEINSREFIVEKSADGNLFKAFETIKAAGNSGTLREYSSLDQSNLDGKRIFYRLKQVDQDLRYSYSKVITADCSRTMPAIRLFPNPATETLTVYSPLFAPQSISIVGMDGKELMRKLINGSDPSIVLDVSNLSTGMYILVLRSGQQVLYEKFIK